MTQYIHAWATWNTNLFVCGSPLDAGLWRKFQVNLATNVQISGHIGLKHRGNYSSAANPQQLVGWGVRGAIRGPFISEAAINAVQCGPATNMPGWLLGCKDSGNLTLEQHYATAQINGYAKLTQPGWYRFEIWGNCHGSTDGPPFGPNESFVEVNGEGGALDPYNNIVIRLEEA